MARQPEGVIAIAADQPANDAVRSVWLRPRRSAGRTDPPLTLTRIVETAVELLDERGVDGLTMRRLAERLGIAAPSLYGHVETKDDVIDLAVDAIFGEAPAPARSTKSWRRDVAKQLSAWRSALLRHPWAATVPARRRPSIGPNFLAGMEVLQARLVRAGFTGRDLSAATWSLYNHVVGSASSQSVLHITGAERRRGQEQLQSNRDRYPTLAAHGYLYDDDWDHAFTAGLDYLLDGLEVQLNRADHLP